MQVLLIGSSAPEIGVLAMAKDLEHLVLVDNTDTLKYEASKKLVPLSAAAVEHVPAYQSPMESIMSNHKRYRKTKR